MAHVAPFGGGADVPAASAPPLLGSAVSRRTDRVSRCRREEGDLVAGAEPVDLPMLEAMGAIGGTVQRVILLAALT
jgi:hypothetical protein